MINVNTTPRLLWCDPWMGWLLRRQPLVFIAGRAVASNVFDISIDARPVDGSSCQLLHSLHAEMTQMQNLKDLGLQC
ncbi:hypothetical protein PoB_002123200 [Plakobranchus ocellatus]|uniref:Uncharacterized protein n=1 Tax=Plakobranchus ocellatus TaxID=259542 RepID=A0AAV3ZHC9_9GAST|nr:hypothetical protein PoB_002123200 [Plakobranchus ocellatus]